MPQSARLRPGDRGLSRPRRPEWYDEGIGQQVKERDEQEEIAAGFE
jgi:hypothetical protein